ncbi:MAG: toll/interleukin-1 receptor domain-containing protein [Lachnospira sp.]|nr:toll/interleukin-1 receptor domain-containing protein [Lachnospira sp.]
MAKTVFISYSSYNDLFVNRIIEMIEKAGLLYWKAPEMIPAGSNYAKEIPKAIQSCDIFLLVVSKESQESIWVEKEVDSAINYRKAIVPVKIDDEPLNDMYKFYLNNVQMISFMDEKDKLCKLLENSNGNTGVRYIVEQSSGNKQDMESRKENIRIQNTFTLNKAPVECEYCQGALEKVSMGVYRCTICGRESYDYFQKVKRYLQENGPTNAVIISKDTGVPKQAIDYFLKEEYLDIFKGGRR